MFKKFSLWFVKSLIVLIIATLIFSSITTDFPNFLKVFMGDIYEYANPETQRQVIDRLAQSCSALGQDQNVVSMNQVCNNKSMLDSMKENCADFRELKKRNIRIENEQQVIETCQQIESGEIERACKEIASKKSIALDFSNIGVLCNEYKSGKINDKEFFFSVISGTFPIDMELTQLNTLQKYNSTITYLNKNKILYFIILTILVIVLYVLILDVKLFFFLLAEICFSIGALIMLPYVAILAYEKFVGIDTTNVLGSLLGNIGNLFQTKAIISVILLMFLRTYNSFILTLGIIFLTIGIFGKIYRRILKKQTNVSSLKENKERQKEKTTQEILDELEEMYKKKTKKN